jgi:hypothetical protein
MLPPDSSIGLRQSSTSVLAQPPGIAARVFGGGDRVRRSPDAYARPKRMLIALLLNRYATVQPAGAR